MKTYTFTITAIDRTPAEGKRRGGLWYLHARENDSGLEHAFTIPPRLPEGVVEGETIIVVGELEQYFPSIRSITHQGRDLRF